MHFSGKNRWLAPVIFKSTCKINVAFFPFDEQVLISDMKELASNLFYVNYGHFVTLIVFVQRQSYKKIGKTDTAFKVSL